MFSFPSLSSVEPWSLLIISLNSRNVLWDPQKSLSVSPSFWYSVSVLLLFSCVFECSIRPAQLMRVDRCSLQCWVLCTVVAVRGWTWRSIHFYPSAAFTGSKTYPRHSALNDKRPRFSSDLNVRVSVTPLYVTICRPLYDKSRFSLNQLRPSTEIRRK